MSDGDEICASGQAPDGTMASRTGTSNVRSSRDALRDGSVGSGGSIASAIGRTRDRLVSGAGSTVIITATGRRRACSSATIRVDEDGQGRHVEQAEPDAEPGQVVGVVAAEQAAARHGAHLVVELRPADASSAVAEPHELDRRRGR